MRVHWLDSFQEAVDNRDEFVTKFAYERELERIIEDELEVRISETPDRYDEGYGDGYREAISDAQRAIGRL